MKKIKTITLFCAAILLSGCGSGNKAKNLVSDFLDVNLKNNDISDVEFSALDSTSLVSDSIINVMRSDMGKSNVFKSGIKYADRIKGRKLYFISVNYKASNGKKMKHTFYMNNNVNDVVCIKTDVVNKEDI